MVDIRCSAAAADEALAGTAPYATAWIGIEHPGPWPARISDFKDEPALRELTDKAKSANIGVVLMRKPHQRSSDGCVVVAQPHALRGGIVTMRELLEWDWQAISEGELPPFGVALDSCVLVCVHGKRDQCCAIAGRQILKDVATDDHMWECSHIGGHRFSPVVLNLADGRLYGRIPASEVASMREDPTYVPFAYLRGRTYDQQVKQAAEVHVRTVHSLERSFDISDITMHSQDDTVRVHVDSTVGSLELDLRQVAGPIRPESCNKEALASVRWIVF